MWRLDQFRVDEDVPGDEVFVDGDEGFALMRKSEAIAFARQQGASLFAVWPSGAEGEPVFCMVGKVARPLRWEELAAEPTLHVDEALWFIGWCGDRDYLVGNSHTFRGRMAAWCPSNQVGYSVSLSEIDEMSLESRYFIKGFLVGAEPDPPADEHGETTDDDLQAWRHACDRFRRTGSWYGRWGTCAICGRVLLPDIAGDRCEAHSD